MKIFLGTYNIASQLNDWKYGFEKNSCMASIGSYGNHTHLVNGSFDYLISDHYFSKFKFKTPHFDEIYNKVSNKLHGNKRRRLLNKLVKEYDVFFFVWESILDNYEDFEIIKNAGKKLIVQFVGDEIRWEPAMKQEYKSLEMIPIEYDDYEYSKSALNKKLAFLRKTEKYADLIYSVPNQSQLALREYGVNNQLINLNHFKFNSFQRKKPKIIHYPSSSSFKGTKYILDSINKLKNHVDFDFESSGNSVSYSNQNKAISYENIKTKYSECDILIGQLLCSGGGKQERELLASGKVVMSNMSPHYEKHIPINNPIIDVNPSNLTHELELIINDFQRREHLASVSRDYVLKHHNPITITKRVLNDLEKGGYNGYTYSPTFFRDKYIPEKEYLNSYNEWNDFVKDEVWYKQNIPSKERSGLIF